MGEDRCRNVDRIDGAASDERLEIVKHLSIDVVLEVTHPHVWRTERVTGSLADRWSRCRTLTPLPEHLGVFSTTRHQSGDTKIVVAALAEGGIASQVRRDDPTTTDNANANRIAQEIASLTVFD